MSMQPRTVYYEVAPLPPLINPGSPITAPGVPPYGVVWCVTGVAHLLVWITAAATSWMAAQHAMDMDLFENLSLLALVSIILTFVCAAVGALGSSSRAPGVQVAGTSSPSSSPPSRSLHTSGSSWTSRTSATSPATSCRTRRPSTVRWCPSRTTGRAHRDHWWLHGAHVLWKDHNGERGSAHEG